MVLLVVLVEVKGHVIPYFPVNHSLNVLIYLKQRPLVPGLRKLAKNTTKHNKVINTSTISVQL